MDYLVESGSIAPTVLSRRFNAQLRDRSHSINSMPVPADGPRKFAILPSIAASPLCTPTIDTPPSVNSHNSQEEYTTAPNSPSSSQSHCISFPPLWVFTPPTPPPKMVRRSTVTHPTPQVPHSASFPAANISHEVGYPMKRCSSVPSKLLQRSSPSQRSNTHARDPPSDILSSDNIKASYDATVRPSIAKRPSTSRPKPLFHVSLSSDALSDTEDYSPRILDSPERMNEDISVEAAWSDVESDDSKQLEKAKSDLRKYHALKELIDTEIGYLLDLRALVTVYLRILPTVQCLPAPPSSFTSFTSSPWINSHMYVSGLSASSTAISDSSTPSPHGLSATRYLLSHQEVEVLTRNAEDILQIHEQFVRELRRDLAPLGFQMDAYQRVNDPEKTHNLALSNADLAIRLVSTKFLTEAKRFSSYQSFCADHLEALNVVKKVSSQHPAEWDLFERRCSSLISELELCSASNSDCSEHAPLADESENKLDNYTFSRDRGRATSMSSLEGSARTLRLRKSNILQREGTVSHTENIRKEKSAPRLSLVDYLIKPIQRICKYPLILDQLRLQKSIAALYPAQFQSDTDNIVESAVQAMRDVTSSVDEARHRQDVAIQSALIASRISFSSPIMSQMFSQYSAFRFFTQSFLSSLGTCVLAGSLDVIYYETLRSPASNVTAKYLGAFLYPGGYLILVKVSKNKVYEPRHWFSLSDFTIHDVDETDAMLPCSIRLASKDHQFELAAACQREKVAWLVSLQEALSYQPSWVNEPTPSLVFDGKGELIPSPVDNSPGVAINTLPTIQSVPEQLGKTSETSRLTESLQNTSAVDARNKWLLRQDSATRSESELPSRRSSTASGKGIFSPMSSDSETIVIRRYSPSARSRVDQGLQDVTSQLCVTARSYASIKDEELFQAPKAAIGGFVRSQSGLSMAGMAKGRLIRHESVRVPRHKSVIDRPGLSPKKSPSFPPKRQSKPLSGANLPKPEHQVPMHITTRTPPSPFAFPNTTFSPSKNTVRHTIFGSLTPSKLSDPLASEFKTPVKTSRSLVNGVKEFFQSRSSSTTPLSFSQSRLLDIENQEPKRHPPSSIRRWAKNTLHRRTRSAPSVQEDLLMLPDIQRFPPLDITLGTAELGTTAPSTFSH